MDRLQTIFEHQNAQTRNFHKIHEENGLLLDPEIPVNLHTREGSLMLHLGIHWITLEMTEALLAPSSHRLEELADTLHFLAEFCLLAGISFDIIPSGAERSSAMSDRDRLEMLLTSSEEDPLVFSDFDTNGRMFLVSALHVADLLKNKPWKASLQDPDAFNHGEFERRVAGMWYWFGACVRTAGINSQQLFEAYLGKEQVNYERIESGV